MRRREASRRRRRRIVGGPRRGWFLLLLVPALWLTWHLRARAAAAGAGLDPAVIQPAPNPFVHPDAALTQFDLLPALAPEVLASQDSSVDPAAHNNDGAPGNILFRTAGGASVILDAAGPGVVDDIWVAGSLRAMGNIVITLDSAPTPVVDMPATEFFSGKVAPFLAPLVGNASTSSGGNYAYVPIAFNRSCVIAFTGTTAYWHVAYRRLPAGTTLRTFSGSANLSAAAAVWSRAGQDPWPAGGAPVRSGQVRLPAGATVPIARLSGPAEIQSLQLTVPSAAVAPPAPVTASGVAFTGTSSFTMSLDPNNAGVVLTRRFDYALVDQQAAVAVDGTPVGAFSSPGSTNGPYLWREDALTIPARLTAGRSSIRITVTAADAFTAFTYRAYALVDGSRVLSDTLEMTPASEAAHGWSAPHVLWQRSVTSSALPASVAQSEAVLSQLRLQIRFDGAAAPAVDAPLDLFFLTGFGASTVRALMTSVEPASGTLSAYWPMPFARQAVVTLTNTGQAAVADVAYRIQSRPDPGAGAALASGAAGYFHATYDAATPTSPGSGYPLLTASGTGKLVGVSVAMSTPPGMPYGLENLQGNAMITLDGAPDPTYRGTGTEDFFQGGWYFENGPFTLPTQGSPQQWVGPHYAAHIAAYRLFLSDAIPFYNGIRAALQVGPEDNLQADYRSVAFWYGRSQPTLTRVDRLLPADPANAAAHAFTAVGGAIAGPFTGVYPGIVPSPPLSATGESAAVSTFTVHVPPANAGVELRAQLDACPGHQAAEVYVDGHDVGLWSEPGANCAEIWTTSRFLIPAALSRGASSLRIRLVALPGPGAAAGTPPTWTAFAYDVLAWAAPGRPAPQASGG